MVQSDRMGAEALRQFTPLPVLLDMVQLVIRGEPDRDNPPTELPTIVQFAIALEASRFEQSIPGPPEPLTVKPSRVAVVISASLAP